MVSPLLRKLLHNITRLILIIMSNPLLSWIYWFRIRELIQWIIIYIAIKMVFIWILKYSEGMFFTQRLNLSPRTVMDSPPVLRTLILWVDWRVGKWCNNVFIPPLDGLSWFFFVGEAFIHGWQMKWKKLLVILSIVISIY